LRSFLLFFLGVPEESVVRTPWPPNSMLKNTLEKNTYDNQVIEKLVSNVTLLSPWHMHDYVTLIIVTMFRPCQRWHTAVTFVTLFRPFMYSKRVIIHLMSVYKQPDIYVKQYLCYLVALYTFSLLCTT
jgi:hypothetical protein